MKKLIFILSIVFLMLQSCSSGDDNDGSSTDNFPSEGFIQGPNISDVNGFTYPTIITSCSQTWMQKNLNTSNYRNGDPIPQVTDPSQWAKLTTGAWCYYNNDPKSEAIYGKLYNFFAVIDSRGLAPKGWHIPSAEEWSKYENCLGGWQVAGGKMKSTVTGHWAPPNLGANNSSGFTAVAGGAINSTLPGSTTPSASFTLKGYYANWWSSTYDSSDKTHAYAFSVFYDKIISNNLWGTSPASGFSVRCVKD